MPRLIIQRSGRRKIPPCGRLIEYKEPHSPFQKLIDSQRKRYGLSGRDLADKIGVSQSTLWIWLHNLNGYPHPKAFKPQHLQRLSRALKIPESKIRSTLDASRHIFTPRENPTPQEPFDALGSLIEILENDKRHTISRSYVLNLAKNLHRGAAIAK
jgi:transcriptional regulator with XRE-family HTH domain